MAIHAPNESYFCGSQLGAKVAPGNGDTIQAFTLASDPSHAGAVKVTAGLFEVFFASNNGDRTDGTNDIAARTSDSNGRYLRVQLNNRNAGDLTPRLDSDTIIGRWIYARNPATPLVWIAVGTIRAGISAGTDQLRINRGGSRNPDRDELNGLVQPGYEVWLANPGDAGTSTSFPLAHLGSNTAATSFVIKPKRTVEIECGDRISSAEGFSTTTELI